MCLLSIIALGSYKMAARACTDDLSGFQRSVLNIDGQSTTDAPPGALSKSGTYLYVRRSHYQSWLPKVLTVKPNARPKGPVKDSNYDNNHHLLYGQGDGQIRLPEISGGEVY